MVSHGGTQLEPTLISYQAALRRLVLRADVLPIAFISPPVALSLPLYQRLGLIRLNSAVAHFHSREQLLRQ